jgi:hypothetical protein
MATPTAKRHNTEEDRMSKAASLSPVKPSPRRVLGELTSNARTTPRKQLFGAKDTTKTTPFESPLKQSQALTPQTVLSKKESYGLSTQASSKKRAIEDVDAPEEQGSPVRRQTARGNDMDPTGLPPFPAGLASPPVSLSRNVYSL